MSKTLHYTIDKDINCGDYGPDSVTVAEFDYEVSNKEWHEVIARLLMAQWGIHLASDSDYDAVCHNIREWLYGMFTDDELWDEYKDDIYDWYEYEAKESWGE